MTAPADSKPRAPRTRKAAAPVKPAAPAAPEAASEAQDAPEPPLAAWRRGIKEGQLRLLAPLEHYNYPSWWSNAWHAGLDAELDAFRAEQALRQEETEAERDSDLWLIYEWACEARQRTKDRRAAVHQAMLAAASVPAIAPAEGLEPLPEAAG